VGCCETLILPHQNTPISIAIWADLCTHQRLTEIPDEDVSRLVILPAGGIRKEVFWQSNMAAVGFDALGRLADACLPSRQSSFLHKAWAELMATFLYEISARSNRVDCTVFMP
jgi:hypothetical protein